MKVYVVFYNERNCNIAQIFISQQKAREFIESGNGLYMDTIESYYVN